MEDVQGPEKGVAYPIALGESILGKRQRQDYCSVRYDFRPKSFERFQEGAFHIQTTKEGKKVTVQLPNRTSGQNDLEFVGRYEQSKDDLDCVAIFDGKQFRLELLAGTVKNMRHNRTVSKFSIPLGTSTHEQRSPPRGSSPTITNTRSALEEDEEATDDEFEKDLTMELEDDDDKSEEPVVASRLVAEPEPKLKTSKVPVGPHKSPLPQNSPVAQRSPLVKRPAPTAVEPPPQENSSDSSSSSSDSDTSSSDDDDAPQSTVQEPGKAPSVSAKPNPTQQQAPKEPLDDHEREFLAGDESDHSQHESSESSSSSSSDDEDLNRCSDDDSEGIGIEHF